VNDRLEEWKEALERLRIIRSKTEYKRFDIRGRVHSRVNREKEVMNISCNVVGEVERLKYLRFVL